MKILLVSQYFWPEPFIINDLLLKLKEQGHEVTVFTGKPNYPDGFLYPGYSRKGIQTELYQDIPVFRVPMRPRKNPSAKNLTLNYLSFIKSGLLCSLKFSRKKQFDVIMIYGVSPITAAIPGIVLKWLNRSHLAIWVQDLWPESIETTGYVKNRFILKLTEYLVRGIYYFADTLMVQSRAFVAPVSRLSSNHNIIYYPNSAIDMSTEHSPKATIPAELLDLLESHFCIVFAGNIGTAQAVETIVAAAVRLQSLSQVKLVLVGSGSMSPWVEEEMLSQNIQNVVLAGRFPSESMPQIFARAGGLLVSLKGDEIYSYTVPCKIQSYLSAGRPIIASLNGEGARVVLEAGAGLVAPAEDPIALASIIEELYHMTSVQRELMGKLGREYFLQHFELSRQSERLVEIFEEGLKSRSQPA